jgi:plasmid stabilization system protein ParE
MIHHVILSPDAEKGISSALRWYLQKDLSLPSGFTAELEVTLNRIARHPRQFPPVPGRLRRALMTRFPYSIYFTLSQRTIVVVAVLHQRQLNPWRKP